VRAGSAGWASWLSVSFVALAVAQIGCGDDGVCTGAVALSAFGDTAGMLQADGSLWTWTQYQGEMTPRLLQHDAASEFANPQMCLRLRSGDVSCPFLFLNGLLPPHAREVAIWYEGGFGDSQPVACSVPSDGTLICVQAQDGPKTVDSGIRKISAGWDHYCAITDEGTLRCRQWADANFGGAGQTDVSWSTAGADLSELVEVVTQSGVFGGTAARDMGGRVWWLREQPSGVTVEQVQAIDGPAVQLLAGTDSFCALREDGAVFCWENDAFNYITPRDTTPNTVVRIATLPGPATALAGGPGEGGGPFACALLADTTIWCWGAGYGGPSGQHIAGCN